jgi:hypothetical protein
MLAIVGAKNAPTIFFQQYFFQSGGSETNLAFFSKNSPLYEKGCNFEQKRNCFNT